MSQPAGSRGCPRGPRSWRVRGRPEEVPRRQGAEELLRAEPDHPGFGEKPMVMARYATNRRLGVALHQQAFSALISSPYAGRLQCEQQAARRPRVERLGDGVALVRGRLRHDEGSEDRSPRRATATREPTRRHPAQLPQDRHELQRNHRLATPKRHRRMTRIDKGCLPSPKNRYAAVTAAHFQSGGHLRPIRQRVCRVQGVV